MLKAKTCTGEERKGCQGEETYPTVTYAQDDKAEFECIQYSAIAGALTSVSNLKGTF